MDEVWNVWKGWQYETGIEEWEWELQRYFELI